MKINRKTLRPNEVFKIAFFLSIFVILGLLLFSIPRYAVPLGVAYVLGLILEPIIPQVGKFGFSRVTSIVIVFLSFFIVTAIPIVKVVPLIKQETDNFRYYIPKVERYLKKSYVEVKRNVKKHFGVEMGDQNLVNDGIAYVEQSTKDVLLKIPTLVTSALEWMLIVPLFLLF